MRIPSSEVRERTEDARTPTMPTIAIRNASAANDATNIAFRRRGTTVASRMSSSVETLSMICRGAVSWMY